MLPLTFTLLSDGSSDRCLLPIVRWAIDQALQDYSYQQAPQWADLRSLPNPPRSLTDRIRLAVELFPCQLLIVHRDAEKQEAALREQEIEAALAALTEISLPPTVKIIPIRMQETWLLIEEQAIREAAGNPHGEVRLNLPKIARLEDLAEPKQALHEALLTASELSGRRLRNFSPHARTYQIAEFITDFQPLRKLAGFQTFEADIRRALEQLPDVAALS